MLRSMESQSVEGDSVIELKCTAVIVEPRHINLLMFPLLFAINDGTGCHDLSFVEC